jgi:hypothetical protein
MSVMAGLVPAIHVLALENDSALTPFIPAPAYAGAGSSGKPEQHVYVSGSPRSAFALRAR